MCYSAMVDQRLKSLGLRFQARVEYSLFEEVFRRRAEGEKLGLSAGLEFNFSKPETEQEKTIHEYIAQFASSQIQKVEQDLFAQKKRLTESERKLMEKPTKTAEKEKAVAERQIKRFKDRLERLKSDQPTANDSRIFAFDWAPVLIWQDGQRAIIPMRYHLRPNGMTEDFDRKYPGCYNARRDSLTGFWKRQFGKKHAVLIITSFFENVKKNDYEKRKPKQGEADENIVLHFKPKGHDFMVIPCIWDQWSAPGKPSLDSFALITDEPPPEIAETGHSRCPVFLKEANIDSWLKPEGKSEEELFRLLDDRERPYYEHQLAA